MSAGPPVLVVDDDADIRQMMREVLDLEGVPTVGAANGKEALRLLQAGLRPRVILLDLMMPVMNGWEFVAAQRADPALRELPVVILSADSTTEAKARQLGVTISLRKPIDLDALFGVVPPAAEAGP
jgi:CheY-like chemotaxis protein